MSFFSLSTWSFWWAEWVETFLLLASFFLEHFFFVKSHWWVVVAQVIYLVTASVKKSDFGLWTMYFMLRTWDLGQRLVRYEHFVFPLPNAVADKNCMQSCLCVVMFGTAASFQLLHAGGTSTPAKKFYSVLVCRPFVNLQ